MSEKPSPLSRKRRAECGDSQATEEDTRIWLHNWFSSKNLKSNAIETVDSAAIEQATPKMLSELFGIHRYWAMMLHDDLRTDQVIFLSMYCIFTNFFGVMWRGGGRREREGGRERGRERRDEASETETKDRENFVM